MFRILVLESCSATSYKDLKKTMMATTNLSLVFIFLLTYIYEAVCSTGTINVGPARYCYQCASSTGRDIDNDCISNTHQMAEEAGLTLGLRTVDDAPTPVYVKNCSLYGQYCVLETVQTQGDTHSFIRDCSDGRTFSIDTTGISEFHIIYDDNQTHCARHLESTICISLCTGDFCNGPEPSDTASANLFSILLTFSCLFISLLNEIIHPF